MSRPIFKATRSGIDIKLAASELTHGILLEFKHNLLIMDQHNATNEALGEPLSTENKVLTTGASLTQVGLPRAASSYRTLTQRQSAAVRILDLQIPYALTSTPFMLMQTSRTDRSRQIITVLTSVCHLSSFVTMTLDIQKLIRLDEDVRQCLLYDSAKPGARLIGVEYMVSPKLYESLPQEERRLWHSHVYEVKSGMLVMPNRSVPSAAWDIAEKREMEQVITLYGKVYHLWQTDKGHRVPLGEPKLMTSYTADGQLDFAKVEERDKKFGTDYKEKKKAREDLATPPVHPGKVMEDVPKAWEASS